MNTPHPILVPIIDGLNAGPRLRVWSLVVTILGDVAQPHGGQISLADILAITARLGVEDGAVRTALSRLAKDGWVESERVGRGSVYRFGPKGRADYQPATDLIYAPFDDATGDWVVAIANAPTAVERAAFAKAVVRLAGVANDAGFAIWPKNRAPKATRLAQLDCFVLQGRVVNLPVWMIDQAASPEVGAQYQAILHQFSAVLGRGKDLDSADALAVRVALIHGWRRLVLRHPLLPVGLQPKGWPAAKTHQLVAALYRELASDSEAFWGRNYDVVQLLETRFNVTKNV